MKSKILTLIIGILIGAIVATSGFLIYEKVTASNSAPNGMTQQQGGDMQMPDGEQPPEMQNGEQPPEKPDGDNGQTPPDMPSGDNSQAPPEASENSDSNN